MRRASATGIGLLALLTLAAPLSAQRMKLPHSRKQLEEAAVRDSNDAAAHYNVALAYWNEKRYDDAERSLRTAVTLDQRLAEAYLALAYLPYARRPKLWEEESRDAVPAAWEAALEESNRNYRRAFLVNPMVELTITGAATPPRDSRWELLLPGVYEFYYGAFDDMMSGKYEQAWGRFQTYLRERRVAGPGQGKLGTSFLWFHGLAAAHTHRYDEATDLFTQLIARSEKLREEIEEEDLVRVPLRTNEYRYFLASIRQAAGEREQAIALYREAIENDLGLYMAHVQLANMYEATRDYPGAIAERRAAVNANPDDPSLLLDLGVTLGKSGNVAEAERVLRQALEANPRDPRVPFWLGLAYVEAKRPAEAREALTTFLSMAPSRYERQIALAKQRLASLP